jgi:hypothetical protein
MNLQGKATVLFDLRDCRRRFGVLKRRSRQIQGISCDRGVSETERKTMLRARNARTPIRHDSEIKRREAIVLETQLTGVMQCPYRPADLLVPARPTPD